MSSWQIGCSTFSLSDKMQLEKKLVLIKKAGFRLIELLEARPVDKDWLKVFLKKNDLKMYSYHTQSGRFRADTRRKVLSLLSAEMEFVSYLGGKVLVVHEKGEANGKDKLVFEEQTREFLTAALPLAKKWGIILCLENIHIPIETMHLLLREFDGEFLRFVLDTTHAFGLSDNEPHRWIYELRDHLYHVHVSDATREDTHFVVGDGMIDWQKFKKALMDVDYSGCLMIELYTEEELEEANLYKRIVKSRDYLLSL